MRKYRLIHILNEVPLASPTLPLCSPHVVSASTSLSSTSPNLLINLLPGVTTLSLSVSHLGSRLLKLTLSRKILDSLSPYALPLCGPALASTSGLLDDSLPISADDSLTEKISIFGCYPCPSTTRNLLNQNFLLRTSHFKNLIS